MSRSGPDELWQRQFRAWVRACHPDVGGDPQAFAAGLLQWRAARPGPAGAGRPLVTVFRRQGGLWLVSRWWRRHQPGRVPRVS